MGVWSLTPPLSARVVSGPQALKVRLWSGSRIGSPKRADSRRSASTRVGHLLSAATQPAGSPPPFLLWPGSSPLPLPSSFALPGCDEEHLASSWPTTAHTTYITAGAREGPSPPITERPLQLFHHVPASASPLPTINRDAPKRLVKRPVRPTQRAHGDHPPSYHITQRKSRFHNPFPPFALSPPQPLALAPPPPFVLSLSKHPHPPTNSGQTERGSRVLHP